jgi:hypothetical protein
VVEVTDVSEVLAASIIKAIIALMMDVASTSETSVNVYQTARRNNPKDSQIHNCRRENLKSHKLRWFPESGEVSVREIDVQMRSNLETMGVTSRTVPEIWMLSSHK